MEKNGELFPKKCVEIFANKKILKFISENFNSKLQTFQMTQKIYTKNGVRSLYQGLSSTLIRNVPSYGLFFSIHSFFQTLFTETYDYGISGQLVAGGLAGTASWLFAFPTDILKTRMQSDALNPKNR